MPGNVLGVIGDRAVACVPHGLVERLRDVTSVAPVHTVSMPGLGHGIKTQDRPVPELGHSHRAPLSLGGMWRHQEWIFKIYSSWSLPERLGKNVQSKGTKTCQQSKTKQKALQFQIICIMREIGVKCL